MRRRVAGRFVREEAMLLNSETPGEKRAFGKPPQPKHCRIYTRRRMAEALPEIVDRFLDEAKQGSIPHTKALSDMSGFDRMDSADQDDGRRHPSLARLLLKELKRQQSSQAQETKAEPH